VDQTTVKGLEYVAVGVVGEGADVSSLPEEEAEADADSGQEV
jgi:hypothetical protein